MAPWRYGVAFTIGVFPDVGWHLLQQLLKLPARLLDDSFRVRCPLSDIDGLNALPATGEPAAADHRHSRLPLNCALNERIPSFRLQPKLRVARMNQLTEKQKKLVWRYVELWRCGSQDRAGGAQARLLTV